MSRFTPKADDYNGSRQGFTGDEHQSNRESKHMAQIRCEKVSRGLRPQERTVSVRNAITGQRSFLRVEADYLTLRDGGYYLPVGVVQAESQQGLVLIELPQEPDAGSTRLWVRAADFLEPEKLSA